MDDMLMKPRRDGTTLASDFSALLLDNASIHKEPDFLRRMNSHIKVMFIPPYCYHLSPLDYGAFGLVTRYLKAHSEEHKGLSIEEQLSHAFRSFTEDQARWCFHQCNYHF
jgi:hypothetical protein